MATVELRFSALPAHVRTARLVAAAVARRSGIEDALLDEVRLAVGEACSRAVDLHRRHCPGEPVLVVLDDAQEYFRVAVHDRAPVTDDVGDLEDSQTLAAVVTESETLPSAVGLAVITGLVDDVDVRSDSHGAVVQMSWSATR
jgi:serine/threonine-protein kinase RsbW